MKRFFNTIWLILKIQVLMRFKIAFQVLLFMAPLIVFVLIFRNYEDSLPEGMAEVLYMLVGFGLLAGLIIYSIRSGRAENTNSSKKN